MLGYFNQLNLKRGSRVFVPLCGKSIDMLWLASQGYEVIGIELSSIACNAFFSEHKIPVKITKLDGFTEFKSEHISLLAGDFFAADNNQLGNIDAVYDRAALIALPEPMRQSYVTHLTKLLNPGTPIFLITTSYPQNEMSGPPFSLDEKDVTKLFASHFTIKQLYGKPIEDIPLHLKERGLSNATEQVYYLTAKENSSQIR